MKGIHNVFNKRAILAIYLFVKLKIITVQILKRMEELLEFAIVMVLMENNLEEMEL